MRRILSRSVIQRALLAVLVMLLAFGPITVAFAAAGDEPTEAPATTAEATETAPDAPADGVVESTAVEDPAPVEETVDDTVVETTAAEDEEVTAQAPGGANSGADTDGPYTPDPDAPEQDSGNGNTTNPNRPCAGCVGNADDKNPPGQLPGPDDDGDSGYECDGNNGVSKGNPAHTQCPEVVESPEPDVEITKNPDPQTVVSGGTATWTIVVTNTGDQTLTGVEVDDPQARDCDEVIGTLAVSASKTYTCTRANVTQGFTNVATVTTDQNVSDDDSAAVIVNDAPAPALTITKSPDNQTVQSGGTATWTIRVTNTGNVALTNVTVADPRAPGCDRTFASLAVGASREYQCSLANVTASFTNVATADSDQTGPVSDDADVTVPNTPVANVTIEKAPDDQLLVAGETAEWDITVRNTGQVALTGVRVSDPLAPDCNLNIGNLAIGASRTYDCELENVRTSFTNVATVRTNETPNRSDDADVRVVPANERPSILLHKRASVEPGAVAGDLVTYEFDIINNGAVTLTNVTLNDPRVGGNVVILDRTLSPGEVTHHSGTVTYTLTQADIDAGQVPNTATATGTPPTGPNVSSTASALVLLEGEPAISLTKSGPDTAEVGETITYTFQVRNTGGVTLTNVTVSDATLGLTNIPVNPSTLTPGATGTASATYTVKPGDAGKQILNTAVAKGRAPSGRVVEATDNHIVDVPLDTEAPEPGIRLDKSGPDTARVGDRVTYTFTVTNTGEVTLTNVRISDPLLDLRQLRVTPSTLAPGDSGEASATYRVTRADGAAGQILNTAIATGTTPDGTPVRDDDDHEILVPLTPPQPDPDPDPDPDPEPDPELPATGAASTGYALTALLSLMLGALFLRLAGSPAAASPSHFAKVLRGPDANSLHMMLRRMGLAPKPGGRQLR